jgi:hypothetical protein
MKSLHALPDLEEFAGCIHSHDDLSKIIRGHQCIEAALEHLISEALPYRHDALIKRLQFTLKVDLAIGLVAIDRDAREGLLALNKIRNRFAHELANSFSREEVDAVMNGLSKRQRFIVKDGVNYEEPAERFRVACCAIFFDLITTLKKAQDQKLWDQATHEFAEEMIADDHKYYENVDDEIKARFLKLKEQPGAPGSRPSFGR